MRPLAPLPLALTVAALLVSTVALATEPPVPSIQEVTAHLDDLYQARSSHARMTMAITTKHFSRTLELEAWSLGQEMNLAVIRKPAREAGTATLKTEDGLWNYAPRADRLMRIPPGLLSDGWMGSHFTNDDVMRQSGYEEDYDTTAAWVTERQERLLRLTMVPKRTAAVVYTKIEFFVTGEGWLPRRAVYWDDEEVVRNEHFRSVKTFGERRVPTVIEVVPTDKPGESTVVTYTAMTFDAPVDKRLFTPRGLRKKAQQR
jgi:hypothetical protein